MNVSFAKTALPAALLLAAAAAYSNVHRCDFVALDDAGYVTDNRAVRRPHGLLEIWTSLEMPKSATNWPITFTTYWLEYQLFGPNPAAFHLVNAALHLVAAWLLAKWLIALTSDPALAWTCSLLFAVHPMNVDSVAWVSERKNVLSGVFFFACLWAYCRQRRQPSGWSYLVYVLLLTSGLLSKSSVVVAPIVALLIDRCYFAREPLLVSLRRQALPLILCLFSAVATLLAERNAGSLTAYSETAGQPTAYRVTLAAQSLASYAAKLAVPFALPVFYPPFGANTRDAALAGLGLVLVGFILWQLRRQLPTAMPFGIALFTLGVLPVSGLVSFGWLRFSPLGNHLAYLPSAGLLLALSAAGLAIVRRWQAPSVVSVLILSSVVVLFAQHSRARVERWRDSEALLGPVDQETPNRHVWLAKANWLTALTGSETRALAFIDRLIAQEPAWLPPRLLRVQLAHRLGDGDEVSRQLAAARKIAPENARESILFANLLQQLGLSDEALEHYRLAHSLAVQADVLRNMGAILAARNEPEEAGRRLEQAVALDRFDHEARHNLAVLLYQRGEIEAARQQWEYCLWLEPAFTPARQALQRIARPGPAR